MIPRWIPQTQVDGGWLFAGRPHLRQQLEGDGLRYVCPKIGQDIEIWVPKKWALVARFEHWYWKHQWWLYQLALRAGFLILSEGDYYANGRWTLCFWQGFERRGYWTGFREGRAVAAGLHQRAEKRAFRQGRDHGFWLGVRYKERHLLREFRKINEKYSMWDMGAP